MDSNNMRYRRDFTPTFLGRSLQSAQTGVAACFISGATQGGLVAECLGRAFVLQTSSRTRGGDINPLSISQRASSVHLVVEFVSGDGTVIHTLQTKFSHFPQLAVQNSRSVPQDREQAFFNYCVAGNQGIFFRAHTHTHGGGARPFEFGDTLVIPPVGSRMNGLLNVLLPNETIGRIASLRANVKTSP
jgi:hypothetical protein